MQRGMSGAAKRAEEISRAFVDDNVDYVESAINLKRDVHQFRAGAAAVKVGQELEKDLDRLLDEIA